jgi:predicted DCC family thiol-disulfide oxidoreductase YuxK
LFDGDCNFCRKSVAWAAERDKSKSLKFQAYQMADIPDAMKQACEKAVHVVTAKGEILKAEQASLFILERCGWGFIARFLRYPPFSWVARGIYYLIAHNRDFFLRLLFRGKF